MMGESSAFTTLKEIRVFGWFRPFLKISQIFQIFWKTVLINQKLKFLCAWWTCYSLPSFWDKLVYFQIKIDRSFYCKLFTKRCGHYCRSQFTPLVFFLCAVITANEQYFQKSKLLPLGIITSLWSLKENINGILLRWRSP